MRINQNIAAFNAYRNLSQTQNAQASSLEKLSSGFRINRAADDAAGLVRSEGLRSQVGGLKMAVRNAQDGISLIQTAEGALTETTSILQRMRDLAVQSANAGANSAASQRANQAEYVQLAEELDRIAGNTKFGDKNLLDGTLAINVTNGAGADVAAGGVNLTAELAPARTFTLDFGGTVGQGTVELNADNFASPAALLTEVNRAIQTAWTAAGGIGTSTTQAELVEGSAPGTQAIRLVGVDATVSNRGAALGFISTAAPEQAGTGGVFQLGSEAGQTATVAIRNTSAFALGVHNQDIGTAEGAQAALAVLDHALSRVSEQRAELGAFQNRFESTIRNINVAVENLSAAESRIRDTDMADEMVKFTRSQILAQAGTAMLAQANQVPQGVLALLR